MNFRFGLRAAYRGANPVSELQAYLRGAQQIDHNAHAIRGTSIKPVRPPENPDTHSF